MFFSQNLEGVYNTVRRHDWNVFHALQCNFNKFRFLSNTHWLYLHMEALKIKYSLKWDLVSFILCQRQPTTERWNMFLTLWKPFTILHNVMKSEDLNATSVQSKWPLNPEVCSSERFWPYLHHFFFISVLAIWLMLKMELKKNYTLRATAWTLKKTPPPIPSYSGLRRGSLQVTLLKCYCNFNVVKKWRFKHYLYILPCNTNMNAKQLGDV